MKSKCSLRSANLYNKYRITFQPLPLRLNHTGKRPVLLYIICLGNVKASIEVSNRELDSVRERILKLPHFIGGVRRTDIENRTHITKEYKYAKLPS
jgi:hypothetical protein